MLIMAGKLGTIVAVPAVSTTTVQMIYVATQGNEYSYKIYLQFNEYCTFWRELDLQLLSSNLVPKTFPRGWLSTTACKRIKALKRAINKSKGYGKMRESAHRPRLISNTRP